MGFMLGEGGAGSGGGGVPTLTASRAVVTNGSGALAASTTTAAELGYVNGVTSAIQGQLDGKQASNANLDAVAGLTGAADRVPYFTALATLALAVLTTFGRSIIAAADAAGVRSLLGLGTAAQSNTGDFAAASHTHTATNISDSTTAGRAVLTAADAAAQRTALGVANHNLLTVDSNGNAAVSASNNGANHTITARDRAYSFGDGLTNGFVVAQGSTKGIWGPSVWRLPSSAVVGFASGTDATSLSADVGLARNAAGVVEANNGTAGQRRDYLARNYRFDPQTLAYAATTTVDMAGAGIETVSLTGDVTFQTSNRAAGLRKTLRIKCDGSDRSITWPAWVAIGAALPATIAANKTMYVDLICYGTAETDVDAAWAVQA